MLRTSKYTTILLVLIVIILLFGVGVAVYYVLDLDWFNKKVDIYSETPEIIKPAVKGYDITKRTYDIVLYTEGIKVVVYKDGTVGFKMIDNDDNNTVKVYKDIIDKEVKPSLTGIVKAFEVYASKTATPNKYMVLLDKDGNVYKLVNKELKQNGKYAFVKIEGLANIVDIKEISNDNTSPELTGINSIAIDNESNEIIITDYLLKD